MVLIISHNGKNAEKVPESSFEREDFLQKYIYDNPEVIPLYEIKEDIRVCILAREVSTDSGPIDAFGLDSEGNVYIIETKLYKNSDKRKVVAQVLDYGASLWKNTNDFDVFFDELEKKVLKKFNKTIVQHLMSFFQLTEDETSVLINNFKNNLNNGDFKFVILMDKLHSQLKDLIIFINQNSKFDIFAVELDYYKYKDFEIMIPKLFGNSAKKNIVQSNGSRKRWDKESFFNALNNLDKKHSEAVKKLFSFSEERADFISWGTGSVNGSFSPKFNNSSLSIFSVFTNGVLELNFEYISEDEADFIKKELLKISDFSKIDFSKAHVRIPVEVWGSYVDEFIRIIKDLIKKSKNSD